jgi:UDPglucose 6-dehydrogenase
MKIIIIGSGRVGQATGRGLLFHGHQVTFLDKNPAVVASLLKMGLSAFSVESNDRQLINFVKQTDIIMVCVDTPADSETKATNLQPIKESIVVVSRMLQANDNGPVVVIRSSVPPLTTEKLLIPLLEAGSGLVANEDFGVCVNPEFSRANNLDHDFVHPRAIVIGELNWASGNVLERLYRPFGIQLYRTTLREAEMAKYISDIRDALVLSFNNEMWLLGRQLDIDTDLASHIATYTAESAWNPQYGSIGGYPCEENCLPVEINTLLHIAGGMSQKMPLLAAILEINDELDFMAAQEPVPPTKLNGFDRQPTPDIAVEHQSKRRPANSRPMMPVPSIAN